MTTFQAIIYATIHGLTKFLPLSTKAHEIIIPFLIGWQPPTGALLGALNFGAFCAAFIYFRHDFASMISSFLQIIIFRKRPMTLDEKLPIFIIITLLPVFAVAYYLHPRIAEMEWSPLVVSGILAASSLVLLISDYFGRKSKAIYDWNWYGALVVGVVQATAIVPGWDYLTSILIVALFFNFRRDAATKFAYFVLTPLLLTHAIYFLKDIDFHSSSPMPDLSWFSLAIATIVSFAVSLLTIGGFMKHVQQNGMRQYVLYRWALAIGVCVVTWYRS